MVSDTQLVLAQLLMVKPVPSYPVRGLSLPEHCKQSPVMLFRAGVGATEALKRAGLLLFTDRSGIDGNLYNHHLLQLVFH